MNDLNWHCEICGFNYLAISGICFKCFSLLINTKINKY